MYKKGSLGNDWETKQWWHVGKNAWAKTVLDIIAGHKTRGVRLFFALL